MFKALRFITKGITLFIHRLRSQGLLSAFTWLYGRGIPMITGIPLVRHSQVTPYLYLRPQYRKQGKHRLERLGIDSSVNLRIEFDDAVYNLAMSNYCYLPVVDGQAPSLEQLYQGIAFIQQCIAAGRKVYIHCHSGVGRAPTMVAAYLISQGDTLEQAFRRIRQVRPFIEIKSAQLDQLRKLEEFDRDDWGKRPQRILEYGRRQTR